MSHQIIKQPNGNYAVWSTIVDDFILIDMTRTELEDYYIAEEGKKVRKRLNEIMTNLEAGEKPYHQFTMTFREAVRKIMFRHGWGCESIRMLKECGVIKSREAGRDGA